MGSALDCLLDHALGHAGTHPASSSPVAHHPDALFVVVGVLAGLARRIVPRVLCVQLLETIALTVCGFPRYLMLVRDHGYVCDSMLVTDVRAHSARCNFVSGL
ncbi:hypothetical protein A0H81_14873 [Grifola frondosa]|uniref:Uncharacterized protein n=1 Tax=Grifola frondosa TaxID=5627 RepID=A0A1C7LK80_GRIFR|nr:hypothetical protein A0H81_14873 [Grifola frondosa]